MKKLGKDGSVTTYNLQYTLFPQRAPTKLDKLPNYNRGGDKNKKYFISTMKCGV